MTTNTERHLSDMADSVFIDREGTIWKDNPTIITLQDALESLRPIVVEDVVATTEKYGLVKLARDSDIENGLGSNDSITATQLLKFNGKPEATYTLYGSTKYATETEVMSGKLENTSVNPLQLNNKFTKTKSTATVQGTIKLSSESMVIPGIDNTTAMTPKLVKFAIDSLVPGTAVATESNTGTVTLASIQIATAGTVREGYAISPYTFSKANATESVYGTTKFAKQAEVKSGTNDKLAISPKTLMALNASNTDRGIISIATDVEVKAKVNNTKAISPKSIAFLIDEIANLKNQIENSPKTGFVPIGATVYSFSIPNLSTGFREVDGASLKVSEHKELFDLIGYKYGGSGDNFNIPDKRGMYTKTIGKGKNITGAYSDIEWSVVGQVLRPQILPHKHAGYGTRHTDSLPQFGLSSNWGWKGSSNSHHNSLAFYTNDGTENLTGNTNRINPEGLVGNENRPWTMAMYELIRVK